MANPGDIASTFASIKAAQGTKPSSSGGGSSLQSALNKVAAQGNTKAAAPKQTAWDAFWHPGSVILNALGAFSYASENSVDKSILTAKNEQAKVKLGQETGLQATSKLLGVAFDPIQRAKDWAEGFGNAVGNDAKGSPTGSKLIQDATDVLSGRVLATDKPAPIDPWVKGIGGFALDVGTDPLTFLPGGAVESGVKGGLKAAVEASRIGGEGVSDVAKTANFAKSLLTPARVGASKIPVPATEGFINGIKDWSAKTAARQVDKTAFRDSIRAYKAGTAGPETAATLAALVPRARSPFSKILSPVEAIKEAGQTSKVAKLAAENPDLEEALQRARPLTAAENADRVVKAADEAVKPVDLGELDPASVAKLGPATSKFVEAQPKAVDAVPEVADALGTIKSRQDAALNPPAQAVSDSLPISHADALASLRKVSYTKASVPAKTRNLIENLGPIPVADRSPSLMRQDPKALKALNDARSKWLTTVNQHLGEDAKKTLQRIKDPQEYAAKAAELTHATVARDYGNARLSDILRGIKTPSRMHDEAALQDAAKTLGYTKRNFGKMSMTDFFRKKSLDVADRMDKIKLAEKANQTFFNHLEIPDGDMMEALAEGTDPAEATGAAATDFAHLADSGTPAENARFLASWKAVGADAYGIGDAALYKGKDGLTPKNLLTKSSGEKVIAGAKQFGSGVRTILKNVWEQNKTLSFAKQSLSRLSIEAKDLKLGEGASREDYMYQGFVHDMNMLDARLRSFGITPVTGQLSKEGRMFASGGADQWAFLGMSDVLNALPEDVVKGLLLAGKNISIAPTLIHDAARYALKAGGVGVGTLSQEAKTTTILATLIRRVNRFPDDTLKKYMLSEPGLRSLRAMVGTMLSEPVQQKLIEANIRNGAFARVIVQGEAHVASDPAIKVLMQGFGKADGTIGSDIDSVKKSLDELRRAIPRAGMTGTDAATVAGWDLEHVIASIADVGTQKNIRNSFRMDSATKINEAGAPLTEAAISAQKVKAAAKVGRTPGGKLSKPTGTVATAARKAASAKAAAGAKEAAAGEVKVLSPEIEELTQAIVDDIGDEGRSMSDLDTARAQLTMGLPGWLKAAYRAGETMSGSFGMAELKAHEVGYAMNTRVRSLDFTHNLNQLTKTHGDDTLRQAWSALAGMKANDLSELAGAPDALKAAATDLWPLLSRVFDHSDHSYLDRAGLDANYLNDHLRRNGVDPAYLMVDGTEGWENSGLWKNWEFDPDGHSPIDILDAYHRALQQASVTPGVAASFSAEFGHKSDWLHSALSDTEARNDPNWVKINPTKGLTRIAEFIDPTQYYHKEMVSQLAMMDKFLAADKTLGRGKEVPIFDRIFRNVDPIINAMKSSITLWRPGHWITNMLGEGLFNVLGGVYNPARYGDAFQVLKSRGLVEGDVHDAITNYLQRTAPENMELKLADSGKGVYATFNGKTVPLTYDSAFRMLDQHGIILHHNNAEDILNEANDAKLAGKKWQKNLQSAFSPDWLGSGSATRDNMFRVAQALDMLTKHSYRNVDDAMQRIAKEVHSYHPTMNTLSASEQKYARRLVYFYTWQRQALSRVVESMIDTPGRITAAPKALYALDVANGTNPQSWGQGEPNDPRIPQYGTNLVTDFFWNSGETLGSAPQGQSQSAYDASQNFLWGASLSAPQLDILQSVFGNTQIDPRLNIGGQWNQLVTGAEQTAGGLETPLLAIPQQLISNTQFGSGGVSNPTAIKDQGQFLINQTGGSYLAKLIDPNFAGSAKTLTPQEAQANQQRDILNWLTGLKAQDLTTPKKAAAAAILRNKENAAVIAAGGKVTN